LPRTFTRVLAVPRSMPISREKSPRSQFSGLKPNARALRGHEPVVNKRGQYIGRVTSCTLVGETQIGMALVDKRYAQEGTEIAVFPTAAAKTDKPVSLAELERGDQVVLPEWCTVLARFPRLGAPVMPETGE